MVQSLIGAMAQAKAEMAVFIGMRPPTPGMREVADKSGTYTHPITGNTFPRVQIITVAELLAGKRPAMPTAILPYIQAQPKPDSEAVPLFRVQAQTQGVTNFVTVRLVEARGSLGLSEDSAIGRLEAPHQKLHEALIRWL